MYSEVRCIEVKHEVRCIEVKQSGGFMDSKIRRIYVPMTESGFYILFCLQQPQHGYGISQQVKQEKKKNESCIRLLVLGQKSYLLKFDALNVYTKTVKERK